MGFDHEKFYGIQKERKVFDFVKLSPKCYLASGIVILVGVVFLLINQFTIGNIFNYGLDFKGGTSTEVVFEDAVPGNDEIATFVGESVGQSLGSGKGYYEGSYSVAFTYEDGTEFAMGYGDDNVFYMGEGDDGYPIRYRLTNITISNDVVPFFSQYDQSGMVWSEGN